MTRPTQDFQLGAWHARALWCQGVYNQEADHLIDVWIWYITRQGEDCWLAHALTSDCTVLEAQAIDQSIADPDDAFDLDVLISYVGEPWAVIEALPVEHAQMQRDMVEKLKLVPSEMERLRRLSRSELEREREREEHESLKRMRGV